MLRGRFLYIALGLVAAFLYLSPWTRPHHVPHPPEPATSPAQNVLEEWPADVDAAAFQALMARQPRLAVALFAVTAIGIGVGLVGFAVSLWAFVTGRIRSVWRFPRRSLPRWSFGELARIALLTVLVAGLLPFLSMGRGPDVHLRLTVSMLIVDAVAILAVLAFATGKRPSVAATFGCSASQIAPSLATGLRGYVAVFPWMFLVLFVVLWVADRFGLQPPVEPIQELLFQEDRPLILGLTVLLACVVGPIAEELFFRGVVYTAIRRRASWGVAMAASAAAFALLHANLVGFPSIFLLGCLLANLYERTGSLMSPLAIHIIHNTLLLGAGVVMRQLLVAGP